MAPSASARLTNHTGADLVATPASWEVGAGVVVVVVVSWEVGAGVVVVVRLEVVVVRLEVVASRGWEQVSLTPAVAGGDQAEDSGVQA